jgi:hypothetical protein
VVIFVQIKSQIMLYKHFYSELGKLLYAVADIDKVITTEEKKVFQDLISNELAPLEKQTDEFGTDLAYYTEVEFDFLDEQIADAPAAFESFISFVEEHRTGIHPDMKKVITHLVSEIANAYRGKNSREEKLINDLKERLSVIKFGKPSDRKKRKRITVRRSEIV